MAIMKSISVVSLFTVSMVELVILSIDQPVAVLHDQPPLDIGDPCAELPDPLVPSLPAQPDELVVGPVPHHAAHLRHLGHPDLPGNATGLPDQFLLPRVLPRPAEPEAGVAVADHAKLTQQWRQLSNLRVLT